MKAEVGSRETASGPLPLVGAGSPFAARPLVRIAKNFVYLALASGLLGGGVLILNVLVARGFGPAAFGQYRFALAFVALFHTLYHLGVGLLIIRDVARDKSLAARALGAGLILSLTLGLLTLVLIALVVTFIGYSPSTRLLILVLAIAQLPYTLWLICLAIFRAFERMELEILVSFLSTATTLLLVLAILGQGGRLVLLGLAHLLGSLVAFLIALALVRAFFTKPRMVWDLRYYRYLAVSSIPFALNGILVPVYFRLDIILVSLLKDETSVGLYSAAFTLTAPLGFLADNAANAIFPRLASTFTSSKRSFQALLTSVCKWSLPVLLCLGTAMTLLAKPMLGRVFGSAYAEAAPAFQVLVWASILAYFNGLTFRALEASNRQLYVTLILAGGALANLLGGLVLISAFGIVGAALAFLLTQAIILLPTRFGGGALSHLARLVKGRPVTDGDAVKRIVAKEAEGSGIDWRRLLWQAYRLTTGLIADVVSSTGITRLPIVWPLLKALGAMEYAVRRVLFASPDESVATIQGHKMYLGAYADAGFLYDTYEPGTTRLFQKLVRPGMVVIDVGAHWGYFTLLAARQVGERGRVYAFEPHPDNWALLVKNVETNGYSNVTAVQKAVADRAGRMPLFLGKSDAGCNSLHHNPLTREESVMVEVTTLDAFFEAEGNPRIDLIKMDIEGGEPAALQGGMRLLQQSGSLGLIVEFHPRLLRTAGTTPEEFVDRLLGWGLRVSVIDGEGGLTPLHLPTLLRQLKGFGYVNLFCARIL